MDLMQSINISASGMAAQSTRMKVISENIANADSVISAEGGPYRRQTVTFTSYLDRNTGTTKVRVDNVGRDYKNPMKKMYEPGSQYADAQGFVAYPNVSSMHEKVDMKEASRAYEANMTAIETAKQMMVRSLDLLR